MEPAVTAVIIFGIATIAGVAVYFGAEYYSLLTVRKSRKPGRGASVQDTFKWQIGKTRASIDFVHAAEEYLETCDDPAERAVLVIAINRLKHGEMVFRTSRTVQDYLHQEI